MRNGMHHIHQRKRVHRKLEAYPHSNKWVRFLDKFLIIVAVIGPLMTLPQIFKIYIGKDATGVSVLTWVFYFVFGIPWLVYGIVHKEKPIIIAYILWTLMNILVVVGALMY